MIYILAGDIRTGKTSALQEWVPTWDNVKGILCPDDKKDHKYLYNIETQEKFPLEVTKKSEKTISVGKFHFLEDTFKIANFLLIKTFDQYDFEFLVLDELGKLELKNEGIHMAAKYIIDNYESNDKKNLLLVVRTHLVKDVIKHYGIRSFQIVASELLP
ncbi:MAG: nucleoside-triphosphatase [Bacteroidia bacterium]|jgi:nucleoside-triphosphatase|nr:nucleoside-triphosphatase [Bacteroidia bacterium]